MQRRIWIWEICDQLQVPGFKSNFWAWFEWRFKIIFVWAFLFFILLCCFFDCLFATEVIFLQKNYKTFVKTFCEKCRPTRWFCKFLTFSHTNAVFFQPNWLFSGLKSQLVLKKTQFMWENVKNLPNHFIARSFSHRDKTWQNISLCNNFAFQTF